MTQFSEFFASLGAAFDDREVRVRSQAGRQLSYITARTAMNRLDEVAGPENWWDEYFPGEHSVICKLTLRLPDGSIVTKSDAGGYAGMADQGDDDKSGFSDSFKRAAVKFGVGRYLYRDGVPCFVKNGDSSPVPPDPTKLPKDQHDPEPATRSSGQARNAQDQKHDGDHRTLSDRDRVNTKGSRDARRNDGQTSGPPQSGRALFAWTKDQEQRYQVGLLKYLNGWAKLQDYPGRMVDWDKEQVAHAFHEACRKLQATQADDANSEY